MRSTTLGRKLKIMVLAASLTVMGTMSGLGCSLEDIRDNIVAGSLDYVSSSANAFWVNLIAEDIWATLANTQA